MSGWVEPGCGTVRGLPGSSVEQAHLGEEFVTDIFASNDPAAEQHAIVDESQQRGCDVRTIVLFSE